MIFIRRIRQNPSRLKGEKSTALDLAHGRLVFMGGFFVLAYMLVALRALDFSVIQAQKIDPELQLSDRVTSAPVEAENTMRADIIDRNGVVLATTLKTVSMFADTRFIADPVKSAKALNKIFPDVSYGEFLQKLQLPPQLSSSPSLVFLEEFRKDAVSLLVRFRRLAAASRF